MSAREVITIQCGHFSNFIGTHWWNIQVVSHDSAVVYNFCADHSICSMAAIHQLLKL